MRDRPGAAWRLPHGSSPRIPSAPSQPTLTNPPTVPPRRWSRSKGFDDQFAFHGADVARAYQVSGYPTFNAIGRDGRIVASSMGYSENLEKELTEMIRTAM